jgi:2-dehydropantoate 2-reductase
LRLGIVGAGAIGCLFGARLTLAGYEVTLIHRDSSVVRTIQRNGIGLKEIDRKVRWVRVPALKGPAQLHGIDVLIVAVKAYDTSAMAASYRGLIPHETTILSLQNGLGNVEALRSRLENSLLAGSTTEGALSSGPGTVTHTGRGLTLIGDPRGVNTSSSSRIKVAFDEAGFQTKVSSNMQGVLWTKTIVNAAINPLSSLTRLPNGQLAQNAQMQKLGRRIMNEGMIVSHAARIKLVGDPKKLWGKILRSTTANKSSMLQDVERGKSTEIMQLNGALVSYGEKTRVKTPFNYVLTKLVQGLEQSSKSTWEAKRNAGRARRSVLTDSFHHA